MRLFIAARITPEIQRQLGDFLDQFHKLPGRVKWVEPHNIHLTLKFLGESQLSELDKIKRSTHTAAANFGGFEVNLQACGAFPNLRAPRVFWIGINDPQKRLTSLAAKIDSHMTELGFEPERRPFSAHLTLGRVKEDDRLEMVKAAFGKATFGPVTLSVNEIHLIESQLRPSGPVYRDVAAFKL
jgi:2'-5' RNA ligase